MRRVAPEGEASPTNAASRLSHDISDGAEQSFRCRGSASGSWSRCCPHTQGRAVAPNLRALRRPTTPQQTCSTFQVRAAPAAPRLSHPDRSFVPPRKQGSSLSGGSGGMLAECVIHVCGLNLYSLYVQYVAKLRLASSSCHGRLVLSQDRVTRQSRSCPCRCGACSSNPSSASVTLIFALCACSASQRSSSPPLSAKGASY